MQTSALDPEVYCFVVRQTKAGKSLPAITKMVLEQFPKAPERGLSYKEIAEKRGLHETTVREIEEKLLRELRVKSADEFTEFLE